MSLRVLPLLFCLALVSGCASVRDAATYHSRFESLRTREQMAAFAFDLMSRRVITPPASIDTVYAIFGTQLPETTTHNGVCTVSIFLTYADYGSQPPEPWVLRLEHPAGSPQIARCALIAPGVGK